jgi:hypothetical protein
MSLDKLIAAATEYFISGAELHRLKIENSVPRPVTAMEPPVGTTIDTPAPKPKAKAKVETVTDAVDKLSAKDQAALDAYEADAAAARERDRVAAAAQAKAAEDKAAESKAAESDDLDGTTTVSYEEDIRPLIRNKSLANRESLVALLTQFGVKAGSELTAAQYGPFFTALKAL